jgi:hypothetical protein
MFCPLLTRRGGNGFLFQRLALCQFSLLAFRNKHTVHHRSSSIMITYSIVTTTWTVVVAMMTFFARAFLTPQVINTRQFRPLKAFFAEKWRLFSPRKKQKAILTDMTAMEGVFTCDHCHQTNFDITAFNQGRGFFAKLNTFYIKQGAKLDERTAFAEKSWCLAECPFNENNAFKLLHHTCAKELGFIVLECDFPGNYGFRCQCGIPSLDV